MDLWYHTPVLPTSLPGDLWLSTSPQDWDPCLWTGTGTSPGTWRMAPSQRTLYLRQHRSCTFPKRSILLIHSLVRMRSLRPWWRMRQWCDLQGRVCRDENWKNKRHSLRLVWRGWPRASALQVLSPVSVAHWWGTRQRRSHCKGAGSLLVEGWRPSLLVVNCFNSFNNYLPQWMCKRLKTDCHFIFLLHCHNCFFVLCLLYWQMLNHDWC